MKRIIISSLDYSCLLNKFSDRITIKVLAVGIPHAEATTSQTPSPARGAPTRHLAADAVTSLWKNVIPRPLTRLGTHTPPLSSPTPSSVSTNSMPVCSTRPDQESATSLHTPHETIATPRPAPAATSPQRPSRTQSCPALQGNPAGSATLRRSLTWAPTSQSGHWPPCRAPSPILLDQLGLPSLRACFHAPLRPLAPFLPTPLMCKCCNYIQVACYFHWL